MNKNARFFSLPRRTRTKTLGFSRRPAGHEQNLRRARKFFSIFRRNLGKCSDEIDEARKTTDEISCIATVEAEW
jgi:hypothetical protein